MAAPPLSASREDDMAVPAPSYDPEVLGGDTCDVGQCCINPCGYALDRLLSSSKRGGRLHPFVSWVSFRAWQIVYVVGVYGGWYAAYRNIYPLGYASHTVPAYHFDVFGHCFLAACLGSWAIVSHVSPGRITKDSLARYDNYRDDKVLYTENRICPTLHIRKLARSKYDRYSDTHVPRFDHHCVVLNQSIGEENYRFFLTFLMVHTATCWYGAIILVRLLWEIVALQEQSSESTSRGGRDDSFLTVCVAMCFIDRALTLLLLFLLLCAVSLSVFLGFHLRILTQGMTTNEYYKWQELNQQYQKSMALYEKSNPSMTGTNDAESLSTVKIYKPSPIPRNIYDLGVWSNTLEVLFPRSLRHTGRKFMHQS